MEDFWIFWAVIFMMFGIVTIAVLFALLGFFAALVLLTHDSDGKGSGQTLLKSLFFGIIGGVVGGTIAVYVSTVTYKYLFGQDIQDIFSF